MASNLNSSGCLEKAKILEKEYEKTKDPSLLWKRSYYYFVTPTGRVDLVHVFYRAQEVAGKDKKKIESLTEFCDNEKNKKALAAIRNVLASDNVEEIFAKTLEKTNGEEATKECTERLTEYVEKNKETLRKKHTFLNREALQKSAIPYACAYPEFMLDAIRTVKGRGKDIAELLRKSQA